MAAVFTLQKSVNAARQAFVGEEDGGSTFASAPLSRHLVFIAFQYLLLPVFWNCTWLLSDNHPYPLEVDLGRLPITLPHFFTTDRTT